MKKKGTWLVFLGSDGSGKSTLINQLSVFCSKFYTGVNYYHFRPYFFSNKNPHLNSPVLNPHFLPGRSSLFSYLKFLYFYFDYLFGYFFVLKPKINNGEIIFFDRHLVDVIVDPKRYRFNSNVNFIKFLYNLLPKPDLFFILSAEPKIIQNRKKELPLKTIKLQQNLYLNLKDNIPNSVLINTNGTLKKSLIDIKNILKTLK